LDEKNVPKLRLSIETGFLPNGAKGIVVKITNPVERTALAVILEMHEAEMFSEELAKTIYEDVKVPHWIKQ